MADPSTLSGVIIDPKLNFDPVIRAICSESADSMLSLIKQHGYKIDRILETHIHADHITAASYLQQSLAKEQAQQPAICIGKRIERVQNFFGLQYGISAKEYKDVFDHLFEDDEVFHIGSLDAQAIHLPSHTPDHMGYKMGGRTC